MLPAAHGDALWIEYGDASMPHRVLVDGGPSSSTTRQRLRGLISQRVATRPSGSAGFELVAITHIDADHIAGLLDLFEDPQVELDPRDVWFNAWDHLPVDVLGAKQGERLSAALTKRREPWNADFGGAAVVTTDNGALPAIRLPDDATLTLLSPTRTKLAELRPVWKKEVEKAGLVPGHGAAEPPRQPDVLGAHAIDPGALAEEPFHSDPSAANGASIAMLMEFDGRSLLLTGDAHADVLVESLGRLANERRVERLKIDVIKLPHHGSKHNVSSELVGVADCNRFLFSTNGSIFHHPDPVAISRVVVERDDRQLLFNYRTQYTESWESPRLQRRFGYTPVYPEHPGVGLHVEV